MCYVFGGVGKADKGGNGSLALLEMRTILAKMLWCFDMELMDKRLDWDGDSKCYTLWQKPDLNIKFTRRAGVHVPVLDE